MDEDTPQNPIIDNKRLINLALFLVLLLSIILLVSLYASRGVRIYPDTKIVVEKPDPFDGVELVAKSALVYDIEKKKVLYEKNADEELPLASVTKIMTAVTALDLLPRNTEITIDKKFLMEEGDSGLLSDERWKFSDLLNFSLVVSSNDGSAAIAAAAGGFQSNNNLDLSREEFVKKMNEKATSIGMQHSVFFNETGLDIDGSRNGGYASARDVAILFEYALRNDPDIFEATRYDKTEFTSDSNIVHNAENTDTIVDLIPGIIGSKTGYTDLAGGNLGIILDPEIGRPIVIAVLGSTYDGRFSDAEILAQKTFEAVSQGF